MKKYLFLMGIVMLSLILISIEPTYGIETNGLTNSNDLLNYIEENKIQNIKKICTIDFCDYIRSTNMQKAITIFIQKYQDYLSENTDSQNARATIIKGFPITKIEILP